MEEEKIKDEGMEDRNKEMKEEERTGKISAAVSPGG
jgi:hypothetical protein